MRVYKKAILPSGFKANSVASGIKKRGRLDLALIYSCTPAIAAAKFTTNKIQAAPVQISKGYLKADNNYHAIIANSGNANAFCGVQGLKDAREMSRYIAEALSVPKESVLVASTGIIAKRMPLEKIKKAVPELVRGLDGRGIDRVKQAIMTTDKFPKEITVRFSVGQKVVTLCAIAKGAGMIAPDMATMLVFILTDAVITQQALNLALDRVVKDSFNCITVDGCMSTNDTVFILANGKSANQTIDLGSMYFKLFQEALNVVCLELAKMIVEDGEGATKVIRIKIDRAKDNKQAKRAALSIANSNLFKTAMSASSPNVYGRIVAAVGAAGVEVKENKLKIKFTDLRKKNVNVDVSLGEGSSTAVIYTSDLTYEYVKINAEYN